MSETAKYRHLTAPYCYGPDGAPLTVLDIASQGDPVVPWAWQLDLPPEQFRRYSSGREPAGIQLQGHGHERLGVADNSLDVIYSSHFIEDLPRESWAAVFKEWRRCLKAGGRLIVLVPERERWKAAIKRGQPPNCSHWGPEPVVGDITRAAEEAGGLAVEMERLTDLTPEDYTIMGVMRKV